MQIEFRVQVSDLESAVSQILANRDNRVKRRDTSQILVSEVLATIRTTGTTAEMPVVGAQLGAARLPLSVLERMIEVAATFKGDWVRVIVSDGGVQVQTCKIKHSGIKPIALQEIPDFNLDLPVDASLLETLGLASLLTRRQISNQGLTKRVEHAERQATAAIDSAAHRLAEFGVSPEELRKLVAERVREAGSRIAKTLGHERLKRSARSGAGPSHENQPKLFDP
jgi:hypothetical protein